MRNINYLRSVEKNVEKIFSTLNIFPYIQNTEIHIVNILFSVFILYSKSFEYIADILRLYDRNTLNIQPIILNIKVEQSLMLFRVYVNGFS